MNSLFWKSCTQRAPCMFWNIMPTLPWATSRTTLWSSATSPRIRAPRLFFEVTWWRRLADGKGESRPIFRARRNFTLEHLDKDKGGLLFGRPRATLYTLTVPDAQPSDNGQYYCRVEEWLLSPRKSWRKISEDASGYLHVSFQEQGRWYLQCKCLLPSQVADVVYIWCIDICEHCVNLQTE